MSDRLDKLNDTERRVLAGMVRDPNMIDDVLADVGLRAEDFRAFHHRLVFEAIVTLSEAGQPVEIGTVAEVLRDRKQIDDLGGYQYLGQLLEEMPTSAGTVYHARTVRRRAIVRGLNATAQEILANTATGDGDAEQLLEEAERQIFALAERGYSGGPVRIQQAMSQVFDEIDRRAQRGDQLGGLPTGFLDLDEITGGLHDAELIILGARPSIGKTGLALQMARNAAVDHGHPTLFISLEMSQAELAGRLLCSDGRVDGHRLRRGSLSRDDANRLATARRRVAPAPLFIDDQAQQNMVRIAATARRLKRQEGLRLLVIDYLQLIAPADPRANRVEQVSQISRRLKGLAKELNIPVLALSQLNRAAEDHERPKLSHLRESGSLEQDADLVLLLHRDADEPGVIEVDVAKNRNGPTGLAKLTFVRVFTRFENFAADPPPL
jgi:replicative DNA helicase